MDIARVNALIAEKVMGWPIFTYHGEAERRFGADYDKNTYCLRKDDAGALVVCSPHKTEDFNPMTDISAAWQVVEKMRERKLTFTMIACGQWNEVASEFREGGKLLGSAGDVSAPKTICLAALRALGIPIEGGE